MLYSLSIRNLVLIEALDLAFDKGLTVLTGETGAGKSMLLDALSLVMGDRFENSFIRSDQESLSVSAVFEGDSPNIDIFLAESGLDASDELILRRTGDANGKSRGFINDTPTTLTALKNISAYTIDIHGQFDRFMRPSEYRRLLDEYGGYKDLLILVKGAYHAWREALKALVDFQHQKESLQERLDYLNLSIEDLIQLAPKLNEEVTLLAERDEVKHGATNIEALSDALTYFDGGVISKLIALQKCMRKAVGFEDVFDRLERAILDLTDMEQVLRTKVLAGSVDPKRLEAIEERLHALRQAARKYRVTTDDLPGLLHSMTEELARLEHCDDHEAELRKASDFALKTYTDYCSDLHRKRAFVAKDLSSLIQAELSPLKLENALFMIQVNGVDVNQGTEHGCDQIDFLFTANPGVPLQPMGKVASGGELSRLMLAIKVVLSASMDPKTLIFDEIDSGVGGATASAIGARLKRLSEHQQVIAITHSPQVAAFADHHFKVIKKVQDDQTSVSVSKLLAQECTNEIARMLAGEVITQEALQAAEALRDQAQRG